MMSFWIGMMFFILIIFVVWFVSIYRSSATEVLRYDPSYQGASWFEKRKMENSVLASQAQTVCIAGYDVDPKDVFDDINGRLDGLSYLEEDGFMTEMYVLEEFIAVAKEQLALLQHRLDDLEAEARDLESDDCYSDEETCALIEDLESTIAETSSLMEFAESTIAEAELTVADPEAALAKLK